jgi:ATP-dependent RNA helicase DeaD
LATFAELGVSEAIQKVLPELGIETPTPIQEQAIPILIQDKGDFIGLAQTGTGKTAAFGLPLLDAIDPTDNHTQALVLAPTRELGQQIAQQLDAFSKYFPRVNTLAVYGGAPIQNQIRALKKPTHIIIATPGRLIDLIKRKCIKLELIDFVVLDEADEMLNMGFKEDIDQILSYTNEDKATWLFSATMPKEIRRIVNTYMTNPGEVSISPKSMVNENISHQYTVVKVRDKVESLKRILDGYPGMRGIIFCRTRRDTQSLAEKLTRHNYKADAIHGDLSQNQRDNVMNKFKNHRLQVLVATDVAARGIDVDDLTHVIHYSLPDDMSYYTHRSGRTARAGKKGISLSMITRSDQRKISQLERNLGIKFEPFKVPGIEELGLQKIEQWITWVMGAKTSKELPAEIMQKVNEAFAEVDREELIARLVSNELAKIQDYTRKDLNDKGGNRKERRENDFDTKRERQPKEAMDRFFINIGLVDKVSTGELLKFICDQSKVKSSKIGAIRMEKTSAYFEVEKEFSTQIASAFKNVEVDGRELRVNRDHSSGKKDFKKKKFKSSSDSSFRKKKKKHRK